MPCSDRKTSTTSSHVLPWKRSSSSAAWAGTAQSSASRRHSAAAKPAAGKPMLQLSAGDQVNHKTFGDGMVISVTPMGGDALIEVAFEQVGTKKLMLKTAGVHMTKK